MKGVGCPDWKGGVFYHLPASSLGLSEISHPFSAKNTPLLPEGHRSEVKGHSPGGPLHLEPLPGAGLGRGQQKLRLSRPVEDPALR